MLSTFKIDIHHSAKHIIEILNNAGHEAYAVGGCVRDALLGKSPHDWDICTSARPEEVCAVAKADCLRVIETGLQHGTVTVLTDNYGFEVTTFRVDGEYSDNRRPDKVEFVCDIIEDLTRRDFTINAMAYHEVGCCGNLIDPWGGYGDLDAKLIRCVRNPDDRFREDALRIMRALRFASTYGFEIEEKTAAAIHRNKNLLKNISAERIRDELCKILCGKGALDILLEYSDVMAVIIPELEPCIGFEQNNRFHQYNVYDHIAHAVDQYVGTDISVKMALLLHDTGKPECYTEDHNGGHFYGHGGFSKRIAEEVMTRLRFDNKTRDEVVALVQYHDAEIHPSTNAIKRWLNRLGRKTFDKLISIRMADICAHSEINRHERLMVCKEIREIADKIIEDQQCFTIKDLAVNGHDVMAHGVESGPTVGEILKHLLDKVLDGKIANERDTLYVGIQRYLKGE